MQGNTCSKCDERLKKGFFNVRSSEHPVFYNYVNRVEGEKTDIKRFMGSNRKHTAVSCNAV